MEHKNEKGFALVLALVLLLVMSLMGGALIVISSTDHQSNNSSDEYQQTFYVAESALLEAEKSIVNNMMGPWVNVETDFATPPVGLTEGEQTEHENMLEQLRTEALSSMGFARNIDRRDLPGNKPAAESGLNITTPCFNSYRNINRTGFEATQHKVNKNFGTLIEPIFDDADFDDLIDDIAIGKEKKTYEKI